MSIVNKTIGNNVYQYEVTWDKTKKKQIWKYIGVKMGEYKLLKIKKETFEELSEYGEYGDTQDKLVQKVLRLNKELLEKCKRGDIIETEKTR